MDYPPKQIAQEELRKNELAHSQVKNIQRQEIQKTQETVKKPSAIGYGFLFALAFVLDVIDFIEFDPTGVGIIISKIIQVIATAFFMALSYFINKKIKRMRTAQDVFGERLTDITRNVLRMRQRYSQAIIIGRKLKVLRAPIRKIALGVRKLRSTVVRNPMLKNILANVLELVPWIAIGPWQTIGLYFMYRDHKKTYEEAQVALREYQEAQAAEEEEFAQEQIELYEKLLLEAGEKVQ